MQIADSKTTLLDVHMKKKFRPCVMRAEYSAQDDPLLAESVKVVGTKSKLTKRG